MKKLTLISVSLFLILTFLFCEHNSSSSKREKLFHQNKLPQLSLEQIDSFWKNDTITSISDFLTGDFENHTGYITSLHYRSKGKKKVAVSVFKTKDLAIDIMEERMKMVPMKMFHGDNHEKIKNIWWWGIYLNFQRGVYINKWNTIVEVSCKNYDYADDDSIRILLEDTAIEIANRVDALSNYSYFNRLTKGQNIVN